MEFRRAPVHNRLVANSGEFMKPNEAFASRLTLTLVRHGRQWTGPARFVFLAALLPYLLAIPCRAQSPAPIYSSLDANGSFSTNTWCITGQSTTGCGAAATRIIAAPFTPAATAALGSIDLPLNYNEGTNGVTVSLVAGTQNGFPSHFTVEAWPVGPLPGGAQPALTTVTDISNVILQANQQYWVVVSAEADDTVVGWFENDQGLGGGATWISAVGSAAFWQFLSGQTLPAFRVNGVPISLEPISPVAGSNYFGYLGVQVLGPSTVSSPFQLATDLNGELYVADSGNKTIDEANCGYRHTGLPGCLGSVGGLPPLIDPTGVAVDASLNVYIADNGSKQILRNGTVFAGNGQTGPYPGDGQAATTVPISPYQLAVDPSGSHLYFLDLDDPSGGAVRDVSGGVITTVFSGQEVEAIATDPSGNLYIATISGSVLGPPSLAPISLPSLVSNNGPFVSLAIAPSGALYLSAIGEDTGIGSVLAVAGGVANFPAFYSGRGGIAVDSAGQLYVDGSDGGGNNQIWQYVPTALVTYTFQTQPTIPAPANEFPVTINGGHGPIADLFAGTTNTINAASPVPGQGAQYVFQSWSDGGAQTHTITVPNPAVTPGGFSQTLTANYTAQYEFTATSSNPNAGTLLVSPALPQNGYYNAGTVVTLTAKPAAGYWFTGWSGALSGYANPQQLTMSGPETVQAYFAPLGTGGGYNLTVTVTGQGTVTSTDGYISCPGTCTTTYQPGATVTLNATPGSGATFAGWGGACSGTGACNLTMSATTTVSAAFNAAGSPLAFAGSIAQVVSGGNTWTTQFTLINTSSATAQFSLNFYDLNGNNLQLPVTFPNNSSLSPTTTAGVSGSINGNSSLLIQTNGLSDPTTLQGSAQLLTNGQIAGFAVLTDNLSQQQCTYSVCQTQAVEALQNLTPGASEVLWFDNTNSFSTGVAVANVSTQTVTITVQGQDDQGNPLPAQTFTLPPFGHTAFNLVASSSWPAGTTFAKTQNIRGTLLFSVAPANAQISLLGLSFNPAYAFTSTPVITVP